MLFTLGDKTKIIIYFNDPLHANAGQFLRSQSSEVRIGVFRAIFSDAYKSRMMSEFKDNKSDLLLSSAVEGVGYDIDEVERVIQWGYPPSMSSLIRHLDQATCNPIILGLC